MTTSATELAQEVAAALRVLVGKPCWRAQPLGHAALWVCLGERRRVAGGAFGSDENMGPRVAPEFSLFIECAWRIERGGASLGGERLADLRRGTIAEALRELGRRHLIAVDVVGPSLDLTATFAGGYLLRTFCDRGDAPERDNDAADWRLMMPEEVVNVRGRGLVWRTAGLRGPRVRVV